MERPARSLRRASFPPARVPSRTDSFPTGTAAMNTPRHVSRRAFLSGLRRSGLLSREQLESVASFLPDVTRGRVLARALVEKGLLTRFQAERLLVGRTDGFLLDQYLILEELG